MTHDALLDSTLQIPAPEATLPLLQVQQLVKRFVVGGSRTHPHLLHAVDGVDFAIAAGESVGLVGESGCGKSTLIRLITRLLEPTAGQIWFDGRNIGQIPMRKFVGQPERAQVQMVFQDPSDSLNPRFTAFKTIAEPLLRLGHLQPDNANLRGRALQCRVQELADLVGLPQELLHRLPHQLSGGQKARVGIARAIALSPKLLILDEPTSALDVSVQAIILHLLADLKARLGMSYLFVSHDLNVVRLLCERVLVMYLGQIIESGPVEEIFTRPRHPYTQALVAAIPSFAGRSQHVFLSGEPRSPIDPDPQVCRLYGRCPQGQPSCQQEMPQLRRVGSGHDVACHFLVNE